MNSAPSPNTTTSDRLTTLLSYGFLLLLIYLVFRIYEPFLPALGWAAILVIFFYPMHHWMSQRFQATRAAVFSPLSVTLLPIVPAPRHRPSEHRHVHFRSVCDDFCALLFLSRCRRYYPRNPQHPSVRRGTSGCDDCASPRPHLCQRHHQPGHCRDSGRARRAGLCA